MVPGTMWSFRGSRSISSLIASQCWFQPKPEISSSKVAPQVTMDDPQQLGGTVPKEKEKFHVKKWNKKKRTTPETEPNGGIPRAKSPRRDRGPWTGIIKHPNLRQGKSNVEKFHAEQYNIQKMEHRKQSKDLELDVPSEQIPLFVEMSCKFASLGVKQEKPFYQKQPVLMEQTSDPSSEMDVSNFLPISWMNTMFGNKLQASKKLSSYLDDCIFTVVSYNVLSDDNMRFVPELYTGIDEDLLSWEKRHPKLLKRILSFNPDVICLQEIQANHFESVFLTDLSNEGYKGVYKKRTGAKTDGCATFFKSSKFNLEDSLSVEFHQPNARVLDRDNIGLLVRLKMKAQKSDIVIANTHLLFNPKRVDVKLAQSVVLLAELDRFATNVHDGQRLPSLLIGDFNVPPKSAVNEFLCQGSFSDREMQLYGLQSRFGRVQDILPNPQLGITWNCKHSDTLKARAALEQKKRVSTKFESSPYHRLHPNPNPYDGLLPKIEEGSQKLSHDLGLRSVFESGKNTLCTTFQDGWVLVDHIFYSTKFSKVYNKYIEGKLKLVSRLRLKKRKDCNSLRIPNETCPSDHMPIAAKFFLER